MGIKVIYRPEAKPSGMRVEEYLEKYPPDDGNAQPYSKEIWEATGVTDCAELHDLADEICDLFAKFEDLKWRLAYDGS